MEIIRNLFRRKLRSALTLFGIVIGIYALTVMGSMSEKMNLLIDGGIRWTTGQITVSPKGTNMHSGQGGILKYDKVDEIKKIKGVKNATHEISFILAEEASDMSFGMPEMVIGADLGSGFVNRNYKTLEMEEGRLLRATDKNVCNIGIDVAESRNLGVGDYLKVRKKKFKIIGIFAKTMTGPDKYVLLTVADAQPLYVESNPLLKSLKKESKNAAKIKPAVFQMMDPSTRKRIKAARDFKEKEIITSSSVEWEDGVNPEKLSKKIEKETSVEAVSPAEGKKNFEQASLIINAVILGSTIIAVIVGGLAVLNTMFMAVNERIKEIGIKQALGARTRHIIQEVLAEAVIISIIGCIIGILLGYVSITIVNAYTASTGVEIFQVTPRLVFVSLGFAAVLGVAGGFYPAIRAARFEPVRALKEE